MPPIVGVTTIESTKPLALMVALTAPAKAVDVRATLPVHPVTTLPWASTAATRTLNGVPASTGDSTAVDPPDWVTRKLAIDPAVTMMPLAAVTGAEMLADPPVPAAVTWIV